MPRTPPKKKTTHDLRQRTIFDVLAASPEARDTVRAMLKVQGAPDAWRGLVATPPGSLLETVVGAFRNQTDVPLEIPFFATMHFLSAHMLAKGVTVKFAGQTIKPDLWTVVLASSGSGKTFATGVLEKLTNQRADFPEPASAAKFIADLVHHNNGLWVRDEFAQFLKNIELQPHLSEIKDYLLRVYDAKPVTRNTKKESVVVDDPALCILGLTVLESFKDSVSAESMLDGFAQRFSYVIARRDPTRAARDFAIYDMRPWQERITASWNKVVDGIQHQEYVVEAEGEEAFRASFSMLMPPNENVPTSFFRRIMFRGIRYAVLFHALLGKTNNIIDAIDMGWAGRVCALHVKDAAWLVGEHGLPDLERVCKKAEELRDRIRAEHDRPMTARDIVRSLYGIKNTAEARAVLQMIE